MSTHEPDGPTLSGYFVALQRLPVGSTDRERIRTRIIEDCLPVAERIARRYDRRGEAHDDLVQVARVGLMNAVNRFDPDAGTDFLAYAIPTMLGEVRRYFRDCSWSVNVPRRLKELYPALAPLTAELTQRLNRAPTAGELATALGVDRDDIIETLTAAAGFSPRSLDYRASREDDEGQTFVDRLGQPDPAIGFIEDRAALHTQLETLSEREKQIILMRFFENLTQIEIARRLGISQMHVSRLLAQSLRRMRDAMLDIPTADVA